MALLKFLRRPGSSTDTAPPGASSVAAQAVQAARQQARRRLVGAVVLLGIGIIGFPLVFQTQPRPIPVDIPIEIPNRDKAGALTTVGGEAPAPAPKAADAAVVAPATKAAPQGKAEPAARGGPASPAEAAALDGAPAGGPSVSAADKVAAAPVEVEVLPPTRKAPEAAKPEAAKPQAAKTEAAKTEAAKTEATKAEPDKDRGRFVVQAGAYTDAAAVREVRGKLERMGLKTYTQEVVVDGSTRVRVRVGPFSSKQDAQEVQNKIKAAGVAASLLTL